MRKSQIREALELALLVTRRQQETIAAAQAIINEALSYLTTALSVIRAQDERYNALLQSSRSVLN